jgi:hypothetical protein
MPNNDHSWEYDEEINFPTRKPHISTSEIQTWKKCSWKHKLVYIEGMQDDGNIYTEYGSILHDTIESFLKTKNMDIEGAIKKFSDIWSDKSYPLSDWPSYIRTEKDYWIKSLEYSLKALPVYLDIEYPNWKLVSAEEFLYENMFPDEKLKFKGFIDAILEYDGPRNKRKYVVIDWKTASERGWHKDKIRDFDVQMQLVYYKHYWAKKNNVPLRDIKCQFVLVKRGDKLMKTRIKPITVSVGEKTIDKAFKIKRNMINSVRKGFFIKNKFACKFCQFYNTEHCKTNL